MKKLYIFLGIGAIGAIAYFKSKNAQAAASNLQPLNAPVGPTTTYAPSGASKTTPPHMITVSSTQPSGATQQAEMDAAAQKDIQDTKSQEGWDALGGIGGNAQ